MAKKSTPLPVLFAALVKRVAELPPEKRGNPGGTYTFVVAGGLALLRHAGGGLSRAPAPEGALPGDCGFVVIGRRDKPFVVEVFNPGSKEAGYIARTKGEREFQEGGHTAPRANKVARGIAALIEG